MPPGAPVGKSVPRIDQLVPGQDSFMTHQHGHRHPDQHGRERQNDVLDADHLVIQAKDVLTNEARGRRMTVHFVRFSGHL